VSHHAFAPLVFGLVTLLFAFGHTANAASAAVSEGPRRVLLVVAADSHEAHELGQVVTELLGRLTVEVEVTRVERLDFAEIARSAPSSAALARLFVDLREPSRAVLWFVDPEHDRILVRQLERPAGGSEELLREELGHILETSTEGLLAGAEIGLPRAQIIATLEPPPSRGAARPPRTEESPFQIAALYELEGFASPARVAHGPEASVFIRVSRGAPRFGVWLTGQYRWPMHVEASPVGARIEGGALRALLALNVPVHPRVTLRFALGTGTDLVVLTPESSGGSGVSLAESRLLAFAVLKAAVGMELRASSWLGFWGRLGADVDPSGARYVFEKQSGEDTVLRPWPVRPAFALGLGFP
jgi:hypothetical protein